MVVGDVNNDGWLDNIIGSYNHPNELLLNDGTEGFGFANGTEGFVA